MLHTARFVYFVSGAAVSLAKPAERTVMQSGAEMELGHIL